MMVVNRGGQACVASGPLYFGRQPPTPPSHNPAVVSVSDLPDYRPAIGANAVRADADGNLWIRTLAPQSPGGTVFDIVSGNGVLTDRLRVPPGYTVVGFGKGRAVYLSMRDAAGVHLARVQLK
jgi:hypothetical protein